MYLDVGEEGLAVRVVAHHHLLLQLRVVPSGTLLDLLRRIVKRFRGGLVLKAHRLLYHSTLGSIVIKKKKG